MALDDPGERPDQRDEDREDDTDRAIKLAREHVIDAVRFLATVLHSEPVPDTTMLQVAAIETRIKAATTLLEVAGCL